nr:hypothetical protein [Tanacetum cinerariifolium]
YSKPEDPNELFQKLLGDLKELAEYGNSPSRDHPIFLNDNEDHSSDEIATSNSNKQSMEDTMLELVKICQEKEFLCIHDNVEDLIESALNSKLLLINSNSQRLEKEQQEVKNVVKQPAERGNHNIQSLQNFRVIRKSFISLNYTSQISSIHAVATILSTKELSIQLVWDIEYVEASLSNPEIVSEENDVHQEEEEVDLEYIFQIQDVVLCKKLLSITRLISNIGSLNDNPTPDFVLNSFESDNSLLDNFSPEFETFCDNTEETRSGNTTHADNSLPEYDLFCFEIEPDQEKFINLVKNNISDDSSNDPLLEEADLFLAFDNSIQPGIENVADDSEGDIRFFEALLIDDFILSHESSDSYFEDNLLVPLPPLEPPDEELDFEIDFGDEILVVRNTIVEFECIDARIKFDVFNDENDDYSYFMFSKVFSLLSAESEDTIFDPGISI